HWFFHRVPELWRRVDGRRTAGRGVAPHILRREPNMAKIIGGIGMSHVPTIGVAYDKQKWTHPAWAPLFEGARPVHDWLERNKPDVLVFLYNDHLNSFYYDLYPSFSIGVAPEYDVADEGAGRRPLPKLPGDTALAGHLAEQL